MSRIPSITRALLLTLLLFMGLGSPASAACHEVGQSRSQASCTCCSPKSISCCQPNTPSLHTANTAHTLTPCPCALKPYTENATHALPGVSLDFDLLLPQDTQRQPLFYASAPILFAIETSGIFGNHSPPLPARAPPHA